LSLMDGKNIRISDNIGVNKFEGSIQIWKDSFNFRKLRQALTRFNDNFEYSEAILTGFFIF
jgi:hypothetical protein